MEKEDNNFGFLVFTATCLAGLFWITTYLSKKRDESLSNTNPVEPTAKPTTTVKPSPTPTSTVKPNATPTPTSSSNASTNTTPSVPSQPVISISDKLAGELIAKILVNETNKLKYPLYGNTRNSIEEDTAKIKTQLFNLGYLYDEISKTATKNGGTQRANPEVVLQPQSDYEVATNITKDKADAVAKKIQQLFDNKVGITVDTFCGYMNEILNLGYIYERDANGKGIATKSYDINRKGTNIIVKGYLDKDSGIYYIGKTYFHGEGYPIKIYEKLQDGSLRELNKDAKLSKEYLTAMGDVVEDKLRQIYKQTKSLNKEASSLYNMSSVQEVINSGFSETYKNSYRLINRVSGAMQSAYTIPIIQTPVNSFSNLGFTYKAPSNGAALNIFRNGRDIYSVI